MKTDNLGSIIFSKVLNLSLEKYVAYIEKSIPNCENQNILANSGNSEPIKARDTIYANIMINNGAIYPIVLDKRLQLHFPVSDRYDKKTAYALRWINTRNEFSHHILQSLIRYQKDYFLSGSEIDVAPMTLKDFLYKFPCKYLDQSRLSRLAGNLYVRTAQGNIISLKHLFVSAKRKYAYFVKQVVDETAACQGIALTDLDIQYELKKRSINLTVRTICNYRKLLNIPHYKERASSYYGKDIAFSDYKTISEKKFNSIPAEPGVYELSLAGKIDYPKYTSNVIYIGSSCNLRKRISSYSGRNVKNVRLRALANNGELFVRYTQSGDYKALEKTLLKCFICNYGALPKANIIGVSL